MVGFTFILIGVAFIIFGVVGKIVGKQRLNETIKLAAVDGIITKNEREIVFKQAKGLGINQEEVEKLMDNELKNTSQNPEASLIDKIKEAGNKFEEFVVSKFNPDYYVLKEWAGDKYINGIYAETTKHPDLLYCFRYNEIEELIAVECKYRSSFFNDEIKWAKENQSRNYFQYQVNNRTRVFVAIGVGGKPHLPDDLFIVPLEHIREINLSRNFLEKYRKRDFKTKNLYYDIKTKTLI